MLQQRLEPIKITNMIHRHNHNKQPIGASLSLSRKKVQIDKYCQSFQTKQTHYVRTNKKSLQYGLDKIASCDRQRKSISILSNTSYNTGKYELIPLNRYINYEKNIRQVREIERNLATIS
ncbi:hypothetical protein pb186bvf_013776 [Paramecium bursaria]